MAIYDNKLWLLSHIRNSFISTDDTGMCETVMAGEDIPKQVSRISSNDTYPGFEESSDEDDMDNLQESYEIQLNYIENNVYRQRSNTAQHIEKMNIARKKASKTKHVKWEQVQTDDTNPENVKIFNKKIIARGPVVKKKSLLSEQIVKNANLPSNPFIEFSKFDGCARVGVPTRKYKIFMSMLREPEKNYPLSVCIVASARIFDLIGLTCLKYSMSHPNYQFKPISHYDLFITEDDGEVDRDFPALDTRECVNKFGFQCLGLVEHKNKKSISFESATTPCLLSELNFDSIKDISNAQSKPQFQDPEDLARMRGYTSLMEAPLYQSYRVYIVNKVRANTEVHLGISGDKVEIDPVQQKSSKFWMRQKAISYQMDNIAVCEIIDTKSSRTTIRLVYSSTPASLNLNQYESFVGSSMLHSSPSFKHHDFETERSIAEEIVQKINHILELRSSSKRKEYLTIKQRKANRRSFHVGNKYTV